MRMGSEFSARHSSFAQGATLVERSFECAVRVVRLCRFLDEQDRSRPHQSPEILKKV